MNYGAEPGLPQVASTLLLMLTLGALLLWFKR
jgi:hypothetical protein